MSSGVPLEDTGGGGDVIPGDVVDLCKRMTVQQLIEMTREKYWDAANFLSPEGLDKDELVLTMQYISLFTVHSIEMEHLGSHSLVFHCSRATDGSSKKRGKRGKRKDKEDAEEQQEQRNEQSSSVDEVARNVTLTCAGPVNDDCEFYFHFEKKSDGKWHLANDKRNSIGKGCYHGLTKSLCFKQDFVATLLKRHFPLFHSLPTNTTLENLTDEFYLKFHFRPSSATMHRGWTKALNIDMQSVLEQNQKVEDYLLQLNKNGQYGVILYTKGFLFVPSTDGNTFLVKDFRLKSNEERYCDVFPDRNTPFWSSLPDKTILIGKRHVRMTFQAVAAAVQAAQYCLPVIRLNACTLNSCHTKGVLLAATIATTEMKSLTICIGTAKVESNAAWDFFLANLREALVRYAPKLEWDKLVFMSDQHKGIITGVEKFFPGSHQIYCLLHLTRNLQVTKANRNLLWSIAEAHTEDLYVARLREMVSVIRNASTLDSIRDKWCRFYIAQLCRSFGVRTNNWAEMQNNAIKFLRGGSILTVLHSSFIYITSKVKQYQAHGVKFFGGSPKRELDGLTNYARKVICENNDPDVQGSFTVSQKNDSEWVIMPKSSSNEEFRVCISDEKATCSCLRYHETGIPCPHLLCVLNHRNPIELTGPVISSFTDPIYAGSQFLLAFPLKDLYQPPDVSTYVKNKFVELPTYIRKKGRLPVLRFPSSGEEITMNTHISRQRNREPRRGPAQYSELPGFENEEVLSEGIPAEDTWEIDQTKTISASKDIPDWMFPPPKGGVTFDSEGNYSELSNSSDEDDDENQDKDKGQDQGASDERGDVEMLNINDTISEDGMERDTLTVPDDTQDPEMSGPVPENDCVLPDLEDLTRMETAFHRDNHNYSHGILDGTNVPSASDTVQITPPPEKQQRTTSSGTFQESVFPCSSKTGKELTKMEKIDEFFSRDASNYASWEGLYKCVYAEGDYSEFMPRNSYPSVDKPALIPLTFGRSWDRIRSSKPRWMETEPNHRTTEQIPVISVDVITRFLSLVHINTALGFQSQAFAYSPYSFRAIRYLAVFPQVNELGSVYDDINKEQYEMLFRQFFLEKERCAETPERCAMRCWIITHPTSEVFLEPKEIIQLYEYSRLNRDCFCIVLSPRSDGLKIICLRLTKRGFNLIQSYKKELQKQYPSNEALQMVYLSLRLQESDFVFYRQIPYETAKDCCYYRDYRIYQRETSKIKALISLGKFSLW